MAWKTCVSVALLVCVQVCAHGPLHPRVMGDADARPGAWPWMASLHDPTSHFCGGSLISREWVLSAAHCFVGPDDNVPEDSVRVYLGKMTQREENKNEIVRNVQKIYIHNLYNTMNDDNDIALLHLSSPVTFNDYISPVYLLAQGSDFPPGTSSRIIGWGQPADGVNRPYPGILQESEVFVEDYNQCYNQLMQWSNHIEITQNMICAGVPGGGIDAYCGDSGGPIMSQFCSKWVQFGIISWGIGCGLPDVPNVYTRVSQYQQWITNVIPNQDLPQFVYLNLPCPSNIISHTFMHH